jgi:hypothetical protein
MVVTKGCVYIAFLLKIYMYPAYLKLYNALIDELIVTEIGNKTLLEKSEQGYQAAVRYWQMAEKEVKDKGFISDEEEITFYKTIKPLFTARIEFYSLLYQAVLFKPADAEKEIIFWQNELRRVAIFRSANAAFIQYYENCNAEHDQQYYLTKNSPPHDPPLYRIYNSPGYTVLKDAQTAAVIAYSLYHQFIQMQLVQGNSKFIPPKAGQNSK